MNIEVKTVTYQGAWSGGSPVHALLSLAYDLAGRGVPHSSPGWVSS